MCDIREKIDLVFSSCNAYSTVITVFPCQPLIITCVLFVNYVAKEQFQVDINILQIRRILTGRLKWMTDKNTTRGCEKARIIITGNEKRNNYILMRMIISSHLKSI